MMHGLESELRAQVPELRSGELSWVKFNTAGSAGRTRPKVLLFIFKKGEPLPFVCVKTARSSRDNSVIAAGFENLQRLHELANGTQLFPHPIHAGELDGIAFSIESAAPGVKAKTEDVPKVMSAYIDFQRALAHRVEHVDADTIAGKLIASLGLSADDAMRTEETWRKLSAHGTINLLPQHGDFTEDNVLISGDAVTLIDCDWYMPKGIAGFDIFHFLRRADLASRERMSYLKKYCKAIGETRTPDKSDLFLWHLQDAVLKLQQRGGTSSEDIAASFEGVPPLFGL